MADEWCERKGAKLRSRSWLQVRDAWLAYLPTIDAVGEAPEERLADLTTLQKAAEEVNKEKEESKEFSEEIGGLRQGILAEALFVLHKAANVLGCAQVHVSRGLCSWSLSSAYHAAFFGMKAILQLLGIAVVEIKGSTYLIDAWAEPKKKPNKKQSLLGPSYVVLIQKVSRAEHRHLWIWFQRMLRVSDVPATTWPVGCVDQLKAHDNRAFAGQRNKLHYTTTNWPFPDLHACAPIDGFGTHSGGLDDGTAISDPDSRDFSIALGLVIIRMGCQMVQDLATHSPVVEAEWKLLNQWLGGDCNHLYQAAYSAAQ